MSDQENLNLEDVGVGAEETAGEGRKVGFLPVIVIQILKWVAIALAFILLGVFTTYFTLQIRERNRGAGGVDISSPDFKGRPEPYEYNDSLPQIRGVTSDDVPAIFSAAVSLGYKKSDTGLSMELTLRKQQIQNIVFLYLSNRTKEELKPEHYRELQDGLREQINLVLQGGQLEDVVFREFVVAQ
jgi:flagellar FliL protein